MTQNNNKIEKFKNQFSTVKTVKFKKTKKMDKKNILHIQLMIKSLFKDGELNDKELLEPKTFNQVKQNIIDMLDFIF